MSDHDKVFTESLLDELSAHAERARKADKRPGTIWKLLDDSRGDSTVLIIDVTDDGNLLVAPAASCKSGRPGSFVLSSGVTGLNYPLRFLKKVHVVSVDALQKHTLLARIYDPEVLIETLQWGMAAAALRQETAHVEDSDSDSSSLIARLLGWVFIPTRRNWANAGVALAAVLLLALAVVWIDNRAHRKEILTRGRPSALPDSDRAAQQATTPNPQEVDRLTLQAARLREMSQDPQDPTNKILREFLAAASPERIFASRTEDKPFRARPLPKTAGVMQMDPYSRVAPSVVFLVEPKGLRFATGFVVQKSGWILTSSSVAAAASTDSEGRLYMNTLCGELSEASSSLSASPDLVPAYVYKVAESLDLALMRVDTNDPNAAPMLQAPSIPLRPVEKPLALEEEVTMIGNAGFRFLWSMKTGHVSKVGNFAEILATGVAPVDPELRDSQIKILQDTIGDIARTMVLESDDIRFGQGDSGGPLLDTNGELVGVASRSFRFPRDDTLRHYYVHFNEVKAFIDNMPQDPLVKKATLPTSSK